MLDSITAIAIALGLTEVVKKLGLDAKYAPLVSLFCGVGIMVFSGGFVPTAVFQGIIYGLSASGLYSGVKTGVEATK